MLQNKNTPESQMLYNKREKETVKREDIAGTQLYSDHKHKVPLNLW